MAQRNARRPSVLCSVSEIHWRSLALQLSSIKTPVVNLSSDPRLKNERATMNSTALECRSLTH